MNFLNIGPVPPEEPCAQVGSYGYHLKSRRECRAYIKLLRRVLGDEPEGARLAIKSFPHDFGSYREVICHFDPEIAASLDYALKCEGEGPAKWDEIAKAELLDKPTIFLPMSLGALLANKNR